MAQIQIYLTLILLHLYPTLSFLLLFWKINFSGYWLPVSYYGFCLYLWRNSIFIWWGVHIRIFPCSRGNPILFRRFPKVVWCFWISCVSKKKRFCFNKHQVKVLCVIKKKLSNTSNFLNIRDQKNLTHEEMLMLLNVDDPEIEKIIQEGEASDITRVRRSSIFRRWKVWQNSWYWWLCRRVFQKMTRVCLETLPDWQVIVQGLLLIGMHFYLISPDKFLCRMEFYKFW